MFETVKQILGVGAESAATRDADPEDLFGMSTAYLTMEADLGFVPTGDAALCFASVDSTSFSDVMSDVEAMIKTGEETGTVAQIREDNHGYQWVVVEAQDFEDLVTTVHFAADTLIEGQFGSRLLAAVFSFEATDRASTDIGQSAYWVYSFRRGSFYPFAPVSTSKRDSSVEFTLESVLDGELAVEDDQDYWYALWPDSPGTHPWE